MFLRADKLLISSSCSEGQCSVLVHSLDDESVLFSCYLTETIVSILPLLAPNTETSNLSITGSDNSSASTTQDSEDTSFIVICSLSAFYFVYHNQTFVKHFFNLNEEGETITSSLILVRGDYIVALTGHSSGIVKKWMKFEYPEQIMDINSKVISFTQTDKDIYMLSETSVYQLSSLTFQCIRKIVPPSNLYIGELIQLIPVSSRKVIILSLMGDMVEISNINTVSEISFKKLTQVLRTESIRASCIS